MKIYLYLSISVKICEICKTSEGACIQCCKCTAAFHVFCAHDAGILLVERLIGRSQVIYECYCKSHQLVSFLIIIIKCLYIILVIDSFFRFCDIFFRILQQKRMINAENEKKLPK